ncbi:cell division protein FtsL [Caulobacter sp.]|uniref:cell division protein FtsL n=1 Tax=Caulobacter sp. TaxID=78 RepID=UPI002B4A481C|nr:cell division protein [Caulobacter sp.]HJV42671.1 cell division protein [Caulobacter sp.]
MSVADVFNRRVRGFRVVEVVGLGILLSLVTSVYLAKTFAGSERQEIGRIEQEIEQEGVRKRLLEAEVAHLEQPRRIEQLAQMMQLQPIAADHEIAEDALIDVARRRELPRAPVTAEPVAADALAADGPEALPDDVPPPPPAAPAQSPAGGVR